MEIQVNQLFSYGIVFKSDRLKGELYCLILDKGCMCTALYNSSAASAVDIPWCEI